MPSHVRDGFFDDVNISFVGRPFPLDEADEHFGRLRRWGFNFVRFNVAWEALEHEGPGKYDYDYMDYIVKILKKAKLYGFRVFIDPHQDVVCYNTPSFEISFPLLFIYKYIVVVSFLWRFWCTGLDF